MRARQHKRTGSDDVVWWASVVLSLAAALIHLPIALRGGRYALTTLRRSSPPSARGTFRRCPRCAGRPDRSTASLEVMLAS